MAKSQSHNCEHPRMVEGKRIGNIEQGTIFFINKQLFGEVISIEIVITPCLSDESDEWVHLSAQADGDPAFALGLCERRHALMFPEDEGLEVGNQEVVGLILDEFTFNQIKGNVKDVLPLDKIWIEGTPAQLSHEDSVENGDE